jgi:hypothetical protein
MDDEIVAKLAEKIEEDGVVTEEELRQLEEAAMADGRVTTAEAAIINAIAEKLRRDQVRESEEIYQMSLQIQSEAELSDEDARRLHAAILHDGRISHEEQMILARVVDAIRGRGR